MELLRKIEESAFGEFLKVTGDISVFTREFFESILRRRPTYTSIVHELYQVGVRSFMIVFVATLATGLVMAIQFGFGLARFGAKLYVPKIVTISIVRELGPIFTALMMAGRVGAGIAAEIGSMKVTQQIDAIRALGTSPMQKSMAPKIIACTIACPLLTLFGDFFGILGGLLTGASQLDLAPHDYFFKAFEIIIVRDVLGGLAKSVVFGFIIGVVGCYSGLRTDGGTQGVGNSTTRSVVASSVLILLFDFLLTKILWLLEHAIRGGQV